MGDKQDVECWKQRKDWQRNDGKPYDPYSWLSHCTIYGLAMADKQDLQSV